MTYEEARKIADVICTADRGCGYCVGSLVDKLNVCGFGWEFVVVADEVECAEIVEARSSDIPRYYPAVVIRPAPAVASR